MKKILNLLLVFFPMMAISQTVTQNYIKTATYKVPPKPVFWYQPLHRRIKVSTILMVWGVLSRQWQLIRAEAVRILLRQ